MTIIRQRFHEPLKVFISYSHGDEKLKDELEKHLCTLKRQGVIESWHDRKIGGGKDWENDIDRNLKNSNIILLLISSDFLASDYCYDVEVKLSLRRHDSKEVCVIPIILRPCDWRNSEFKRLQALPKDGKAVTSWENIDEAFVNIIDGIRLAIDELRKSNETNEPNVKGKKLLKDTVPRKCKWVIELNCTLDDLDNSILERILNQMRLLSGDPQLIIRKIGSGSIKICLEGTKEGFKKFQSLLQKGQLKNILGIEVKAVRPYSKSIDGVLIQPPYQKLSKSRTPKPRSGMSKIDLVNAIAGKSKLKLSDTEKLVNAFIETVSAELKRKGKVTLVGFGTFSVAHRKAKTVVFKPGKALKKLVK
jgi:nucleoid DNA-binding protein